MNITLSKKGIDLIIASEVSSPAYYNKFLQSPTWPGGESGLTIGIGADLGQQTVLEIRRDWNMLPPNTLSLLCKASGVKGQAARNMLKNNPIFKQVKIDYHTACNVFYDTALPEYVRETYRLYPGLDKLKPDAIAALVDLIYNRGASIKGSDRSEMAAIVPMVPTLNYSGIATMVEHSKRIWEGKPGMEGIVKRRMQEGALIRGADHPYSPADVINVQI